MFATGIENSYPTIRGKNGRSKRVDEMEKCGHYDRWEEDFALVKEMGIHYLRYGPPYYSAHKGPGKYDWDFADQTFAKLRELEISPIVDLCHFGVPNWIADFQNTDWPELFAEYALAFAQRFPHIALYTPVNEIFITATFSAQYGWWNERLTSDRGFVTALKNLCKANELAMDAICTVQKDATFIQSESTEYFHPQTLKCWDEAHFRNEKRFLSLDLTYAHDVSATMYQYLLDNGMTREEYAWFMNHHVSARCIMGNDYYVTNEHYVHEDGSTSASGELFGYYVITKQYFDRYHMPVMHTETNFGEDGAVEWLRKEWANVHLLKSVGVPVVGFTWYSSPTRWTGTPRSARTTAA